MGQSTPIGDGTEVPREGTGKDGRKWRLSAREHEILRLIVDGNTNKAIAQVLGISPRTVEAHRSKIMAKVGAHNSAQLVFKLLGR
jgi:two-component system, LuxR family, response regulator FixJ